MEGRAGDERDDGRRGPAAARVPRHPRRGRDRALGGAGSAPSSAPTAPGRTSTAGPATCRRRSRPTAALRLAGDPPDAAHMRAARRVRPRARAGVERARVFTHLWLALFGLWSWDDVPALPPEIDPAAAWFPLNIYDFACWARQTIVRAVASSAPTGRCARCRSASTSCAPGAAPRRAAPQAVAAARGSRVLDRVAARLRAPPARARCGALALGARRALDRAPPGGRRLVGRHPAAVGVLADRAAPARLPARPPGDAARAGGLDRFMVEDRDDRAASARPRASRRLEACQSPVWDTALAVDRAERRRACRPTIPRSCAPPTGCSARRSGSAATGRCAGRSSRRAAGRSSSHNDNYPDIDDTAEVVLALRRVAPPATRRARRGRRARGARWADGMQSRDGGWGAFDADNTRALCRELPFCDFGEVIDPPTADVTAHVARDARRARAARHAAGAARASRGCSAQQEADGSWFGRWGVNHVYGTGAARAGAGRRRHRPPRAVRSARAVRWLEAHQNADGGWGEDLRSYDDPRVDRPRPEHRLADGLGAARAARRRRALARRSSAASAGWSRTQRADGGWDEPQYTGTGLPRATSTSTTTSTGSTSR